MAMGVIPSGGQIFFALTSVQSDEESLGGRLFDEAETDSVGVFSNECFRRDRRQSLSHAHL
jgi:hypothetical protein